MTQRITRTIPYILSIAANAAYFAILRIEMFTERYHLPPDGEVYVETLSPVDRLYHAGNNGLINLEVFMMVVSVAAGILMIVGLKNRVVRMAWIIGSIASTVMFIIILIIAGGTHLVY
ncbi:MAG: hypothetical protein IKO16_05980 [Lachnospiraceae bacterium]|nr:hypothetical protein [Lachnospiraceae bacterium]